jgi:hypothetical protein
VNIRERFRLAGELLKPVGRYARGCFELEPAIAPQWQTTQSNPLPDVPFYAESKGFGCSHDDRNRLRNCVHGNSHSALAREFPENGSGDQHPAKLLDIEHIDSAVQKLPSVFRLGFGLRNGRA